MSAEPDEIEVDEEEYGYAAEALVTLLLRHPDGLEKEELADKAGMNTRELQAGLQLLMKRGALDPEAEVIVLRSAGFELGDPVAADDQPEPEEQQAGGAGSAQAMVGGGRSTSTSITLTIMRPITSTQSDEATLADARQMEQEVADAIHNLYPGAVISADLDQVRAYDQPRDLFSR